MAIDYCISQGYWFESSRRSSTSDDSVLKVVSQDRFLVYSCDPDGGLACGAQFSTAVV